MPWFQRHAYDVVSLAYGPQTLWLDHALQGTAGAALHPGLDTRRVELIVRKGFRPGIDSYSAFQENDRATRMAAASPPRCAASGSAG